MPSTFGYTLNLTISNYFISDNVYEKLPNLIKTRNFDGLYWIRLEASSEKSTELWLDNLETSKKGTHCHITMNI